MSVPAGKDGKRVPDADAPQGKPGVISGEPPKADWRKYARGTAWVVVLLIALGFLLTNRDPVPINFLFFKVTAPLWIALVLVLVLGFLLGLGAGWWRTRRRRKRRD